MYFVPEIPRSIPVNLRAHANLGLQDLQKLISTDSYDRKRVVEQTRLPVPKLPAVDEGLGNIL